MSWQTYVDSNLIGTKQVTKAAIHGLDGVKWATSSGFTVNLKEAKDIVAGFSDAGKLRNSGLTIGTDKFIVLKADDRSIYGKKTGGGVVCVKTVKALLIALYDEKIQAGNATNVVEKLADYLIEQGY